MAFDAETFIRPHIRSMQPYKPILPFEVLSAQLGLPPEEIVKLDANENPYGPLPQVRAALAELAYPHIYPDPECRELRATLAGYHGLPVEQILVGAGADELIDLLMRLCLEPGEAIVNCPPTFGMYAFDADVNHARVVAVPRLPDFRLDGEALLRAVEREKPKLVFLASPNNPDGSLAPDDLLERLLALPVIVVLDEAYAEFAPPEASWLRAAAVRTNLVVLRTFSKWAGLAGLRVGFGVFPTVIMPHLWKMKQPYNVSAAAAQAAQVSLEHAGQLLETVRQIITERERLAAGLAKVEWIRTYPTQANFILCQVSGREASLVKAALARQGILVRYFDKPGLRDHIRISVGKPGQTDRLLAALREME